MTSQGALLNVQDLSVRFGGVHALEAISLVVPSAPGIVGLIGPNGAGKTTLFNCISGFVRPASGRIEFQGMDITTMPAFRRAQRGIGRTFQRVGLCRDETVFTNALMAQHLVASYGPLRGMFTPIRGKERALASQADSALELVGLRAYAKYRVRELPIGLMKLLELTCILAWHPKLVLLDEPSSGLGADESARIGEILLRIREELGLSFLLIGHDMRLVMSVAAQVYVLNFGKLLAQGPPSEVQTNEEVVQAYLGTSRRG